MEMIILTILIIILSLTFFILFCISAYMERKRHGCLVNIAVWLLSAIITITGFGFLYREKATLNDINIDYNISISDIGVKCVIEPKTNIKNFELEFEFYDINNTKIFTLKKAIGNIKQDNIYTVTVSLLEIKTYAIPINCNIKISKGYINGFTILSQIFEKKDNEFYLI